MAGWWGTGGVHRVPVRRADRDADAGPRGAAVPGVRRYRLGNVAGDRLHVVAGHIHIAQLVLDGVRSTGPGRLDAGGVLPLPG